MKLIRLVLLLLLLVVSALGGGYFWLQRALNTPIAHDYSSEYITIERGMASNRILRELEDYQIIQTPLATKLYLRFFATDLQLEAGDYLFPSPISPKEVLATLENGRRRSKTLTIPEGWSRFEMAERIAAQFPVEPALTTEEVLAMMNYTSPIQDFDPQATNLEGYLYPTTYDFEMDTHPRAVIERMVQQFKQVWQPEWDQLAKNMGREKHEIITIASLIENESQVDSERALVASVIYNRLEKGIPLGIDATNVYIAKLLNRWDGIIHKSDVEVDHPYNTRRIRGLPPGPICSPSKSALEAALNPASTDYLYYVLNVEAGDGSHNFYADAAGFARGKAEYQRWLSKQRGN
ncbi:MAG: endolytic transglycosylase MltG [Bacteroidota bacterium]